MAALWLHTTLLLVLLATWCPGSGGFPLETLCGSDLVDALQLVCGDRGFFFMAKMDDDPVQRFQALSKMGKRSVVQQCCFRPCDMFTLQSFCV